MPDRARDERGSAPLNRVSHRAPARCRGCCCRRALRCARRVGGRARIASARLWPAQEYTRVILESAGADRASAHRAARPRAAGARSRRASSCIARARRSSPTRVQRRRSRTSPAIRVGRPSPSVAARRARSQGEVKPQVFALAPVAEFGHRLVLDLYPLMPRRSADGAARARAQRARRAAPPSRPPGATRAAPRRADARRRSAAPPRTHHRRDRPRPRRRGSRARSGRAARTRRTSCWRSRASSRRMLDAEPNMRAMLTRDDDYFVPLARARAEGAARAGRPVRLDPRRRVPRAARARLVGVRAVGAAARPAPRRAGSRSARTPPT